MADVDHDTQFGQMKEGEFDLFDVANPVEVACFSVHVAYKVTDVDPAIHLLFSRFALRKFVGTRGTLYFILGIHKVTNY